MAVFEIWQVFMGVSLLLMRMLVLMRPLHVHGMLMLVSRVRDMDMGMNDPFMPVGMGVTLGEEQIGPQGHECPGWHQQEVGAFAQQ